MNYKLNNEQDWLEHARQANWSVSKLAARCGVSVRTLRRYFIKHLGQPPKKWLSEQRQKQAAELLCGGDCLVKEAASRVGYQHATTFSREFKKKNGFCPANSSNPPMAVLAPRANDR